MAVHLLLHEILLPGFIQYYHDSHYIYIYRSDEPDMPDTAGEAKTSSLVTYYYGPPHMAKQKQDDQPELTYSSYVRTQDVTKKTCRRWWTIGKSGERWSRISVLAARLDDDDDDDHDSHYIYIYTYICLQFWSLWEDRRPEKHRRAKEIFKRRKFLTQTESTTAEKSDETDSRKLRFHWSLLK